MKILNVKSCATSRVAWQTIGIFLVIPPTSCFLLSTATKLVSVGGAMTKSMSLPSHMTTLPPDPFPELSRHKMRLYHFQDMETAGGDEAATSRVSEAERRSLNSLPSDNVVTTKMSTTDHLTEVIAISGQRIGVDFLRWGYLV